MSDHARREAGRHIGRLTDRRDWIAKVIADRETGPDDHSNSLGFYRAELAALDWALPILTAVHMTMKADAGELERARRDAVHAAREERRAARERNGSSDG